MDKVFHGNKMETREERKDEGVRKACRLRLWGRGVALGRGKPSGGSDPHHPRRILTSPVARCLNDVTRAFIYLHQKASILCPFPSVRESNEISLACPLWSRGSDVRLRDASCLETLEDFSLEGRVTSMRASHSQYQELWLSSLRPSCPQHCDCFP